MNKKDLTLLGKILYYTGAISQKSIYNKDYKMNGIYTKIRVLHPIGFIIFWCSFLVYGATEGFLRKDFFKDIKRDFKLF